MAERWVALGTKREKGRAQQDHPGIMDIDTALRVQLLAGSREGCGWYENGLADMSIGLREFDTHVEDSSKILRESIGKASRHPHRDQEFR